MLITNKGIPVPKSLLDSCENYIWNIEPPRCELVGRARALVRVARAFAGGAANALMFGCVGKVPPTKIFLHQALRSGTSPSKCVAWRAGASARTLDFAPGDGKGYPASAPNCSVQDGA